MTTALEGEWSAPRPGCPLPPGKTRYPLYRRLGGPQGRSGWAENLVPTGIRSPDRPACSQSLYQLSYRAYILYCDGLKYMLINNPMISVKREVYDTVNWWGYIVLVVDKCEMSMKQEKWKYSKTHHSATLFTTNPLWLVLGSNLASAERGQ